MLSNLVEVEEGIFQSSADGRHSTQCSTLELLALEEGLRIFEKADIIAGNDFDQMLCGRELAESYPEVVCIVKGVEEIFVERVDILQSWEAVEDEGELLSEGFLRELDLSGIKVCERSAF